MVDQSKIDIIMSTIAVLTAPPQQPRTIDQKDLQQVLTRPLAIGQSPEGLIVSSQRDQIEAIAGGNKINIRDLSGRATFASSKIPTVLQFFIGSSQIISYGVNFVITVPCVEPLQWIRDNILSSRVSERTGKTLIGGGGLLKMESGRKVWNIKIDPREPDEINIDFNASEETQQLPDEITLRKELQEQFDVLVKFINDLGL